MKRSIKILSAAIGVLAAATIYIGYQFYKNQPTLGDELYKEAVQVQEKYKKLKAEGKKLDDFTNPPEQDKELNLEEKVNQLHEEHYNEFFRNPTDLLYLQVGAFKDENNATNLIKKLREKGFNANYFKKEDLNIVYLGPLSDIDELKVVEEKYFSIYPTEYLLLKGPIDTDELKIEKEKNLVRLSLSKSSDCLKRNDSCIYNYISQDHPNYETFKFHLDNFRNYCEFKYFRYNPINIKIDLENNTASLDIIFKAKVKCCISDTCEEINEEETEKDVNLLKKEGKYIALLK